MKKLLIVSLFAALFANASPVAATRGYYDAGSKITAIELTWLRTEKADRYAYPQEPGVLVDPNTGDVLDVLPNDPNSYAIDFDTAYFIKRTYANTGLLHLHPTYLRSRGASGAWLACWNCILSEEDVESAATLNESFVDAVYVGSDGHFWRSRIERVTWDGWEHMIFYEGHTMNVFAFARKYPQYVKYTLTRIDG